MRKFLSLIMAVVMLLTMSVVVSADGETPTVNNGTITFDGVIEDVRYDIYKILDLYSYDKTAQRYSYVVEADWEEFFTTGAGADYITIENGFVKEWNLKDYTDDQVAKLAQEALKYAQNKGIDPTQSSANAGQFVVTDGKGVFSGLDLGYYLIDSTAGSLCGLTTTQPDATVIAKNGIPTVDKQVQEDSTGNYGSENTADVGQVVNFQTTINVHRGAQNYVLHDTMSEGLTFDPASVKVDHIIPSVSTTPVDTKYYTVVTEDLEDDCTFEVRFTDEFCEHIEMNDKVIVHYSATVNENAIVAGDGNPNETHLEFGEGMESNYDSTKTYTFGFDIVKTDGANVLLDGAEFKIYDASTGGNEIAVVYDQETGMYRRAADATTGDTIVVTNGQVRLEGFDNGTYYLEETKSPVGFNKLTARQKFIIDGNEDAKYNGLEYIPNSGIQVVNNTGSMLPTTGGIGTTLFVVFGGIAVLATGVVLFTRKRMAMIAEQ